MTSILNELLIPLTFAGIGAFTELILLRHPTPGQRIGTILGVASMGVAGFFIPRELVEPAFLGFLVSQGGRIVGGVASQAIDKYRVWRVR